VRILAIDPGTTQSAWLVLPDSGEAIEFGISPNRELLDRLRQSEFTSRFERVVIEDITSYGMPVGREVFHTVRWTGRFQEAIEFDGWTRVEFIGRKEIVTHLCGSARAKDPNVRMALLDRFGGKSQAVGLKAHKGPLYGISRDVWSALAIALTARDLGPAADY
jgi:hypothetical protein